MTARNDWKALKAKAAGAYRTLAGLEEGAPDPDGLADAKAVRTLLQYESVWRIFTTWCAEEGLQPMPAAPATVLGFMRALNARGQQQRGRECSPRTLDSYIAAITAVHRYRGHAIDRTILIEPLKAARRRAGPPRRAYPLWRDSLRDMLSRLDPEKPRDVRDRALLCLAWTAALREAEVIGLDWLKWGGWWGGGNGFVSLDPAGVLLTLVRSKTSQVEPVPLPIPDKDVPSLRPWLTAWVELAGIQPGGPLFRQIDRFQQVTPNRMASDSLSKVIHGRVYQLEIAHGRPDLEAQAAARKFSGHSMRRGYCSTAARARIPESVIRKRSRHSDAATVAKYIQVEEGWDGGSLQGIGF